MNKKSVSSNRYSLIGLEVDDETLAQLLKIARQGNRFSCERCVARTKVKSHF